jgi:hypothetical protein
MMRAGVQRSYLATVRIDTIGQLENLTISIEGENKKNVDTLGDIFAHAIRYAFHSAHWIPASLGGLRLDTTVAIPIVFVLKESNDVGPIIVSAKRQKIHAINGPFVPPIYKSPDLKFTAETSGVLERHGMIIGRLNVRAMNGVTKFDTTYDAKEGNTGSRIGPCSWTPDSRFFVYDIYFADSLRNQRTETRVYASETNKTYSLNHLLDGSTWIAFRVAAPDTIQLLASEGYKLVPRHSTSLSQLLHLK